MHDFRERQLDVEGLSIHCVEAGSPSAQPLLFLHGWPESWEIFREAMRELSARTRVIAIDLPGIGGSRTPAPSNDKQTLARYVRGTIKQLALENVTLIGHDVGGQITFAYLKQYPDELARAVIMNVAVPGVEPWPEVKRNPHIWHFAFHAVPKLPETLVSGHEAAYFDFFYDAISAAPGSIGASKRATYVAAYSRPDALHVGFEWYRAFEKDEQDNLKTKDVAIRTPVLYVRGDKESGTIDQYAAGLRENGFSNLATHIISNCGHFAPDEQPKAVAAALSEFAGLGS